MARFRSTAGEIKSDGEIFVFAADSDFERWSHLIAITSVEITIIAIEMFERYLPA